MPLKIKIGKTEFDALAKDVQKEYKQTGDDYTLDLTDYEDPAEIKRARDNANTERNEAKRKEAAEKTRADKLQSEYDALKNASDKNTQDIAALNTEWQAKLTAAEAKATETVDGFKSNVGKQAVSAEALRIATKISTTPSLLAPRIAERLQAAVGDDFTPSLLVLGKDGKPCAMSMDDIAKEFRDNPEFSSIMIGTRGSGGGGAPPANPGGGAPRFGNPGGQSPQMPNGSPDLSRMAAADLVAHVSANKVGRPDSR